MKLSILGCYALAILLATPDFISLAVAKRARVIKSPYDNTVYTYKAGIKHVIPDWNTFVSLGYDVNNIETLSDAEIKAIETGPPVSLIKEESHDPNPLFDCPCVNREAYQASLKPSTIQQHMICIIDSAEANALFEAYDHKMLKIHHRVIPSNSTDAFTLGKSPNLPEEMKACDAVVNILADDSTTSSKYECPELCKPVPYTELPLKWLLNSAEPPSEMWKSLTCSMTFTELWGNNTEFSEHHTSAGVREHGLHSLEESHRREHEHTSVGLMLKAVVRRRIEECNERHLWTSGTTHVTSNYKSVTPRKIFGLVLWVGSRSRYDLMTKQIQILRNMSLVSEQRVMGWMASEDQYDCGVGTTLCYDVSHLSAYFPLMPTTRLNMAASGWACAQRRPLRAMSHALLLFDPDYMLVVDDDTYVNPRMLEPGANFNKYIKRNLNTGVNMLGELTMGKKITRHGFYYGGAGYLFGRKVIELLNGYVLPGPAFAADDMRDENMIKTLALLDQVYPLARKSCRSCARVRNGTKIGELGAAADMEARVIEICVNIMSQEHTCYHSDHAISRCLLHGVYAYPLNINCHSGTMLDSSKNLVVAMCMSSDTCTADAHLTCHRWYASEGDPYKPIYEYQSFKDAAPSR